MRRLDIQKLEEFRDRTHTWFMTHADQGLRVLLSPWRLFRTVCFLIGLVFLLTSFGTLLFVRSFLSSLPPVDKHNLVSLQSLAKRRVYDRLEDKRKMHRWIPLSEVSRPLIYSVVLSEDATFFDHSGFNYEAIADSIAENIKEKRPAFGASTISQQVVKNLFLDSEKSITRKIKEAIITYQMEKHIPKNDILELYLNMAEFGPDIFGISAASHHFFNKFPRDMNAAEGAFIGLMLPSPRRNYFSIWENRNISKTKKRRLERVLRDMLYGEFITDKDYLSFVKFPYFPEEKARFPARSSRE